MSDLKYNFHIKWTDTIHVNVNGDEYSSDNDSEVDTDINNINFSLDNEIILIEIEKILKINELSNYTSLEILKKEDLLSSYLSKSILQSNTTSKDFILKLLEWIRYATKNLAIRLKQKLHCHNDTLLKKEKIVRNSYKFCNYKHLCQYNYNPTKKKCCFSDHYIHNSIYADIDILIKYINKFYSEIEYIEYNKEIIRCINTISYVIKHMYEELNNLCIYAKKDEHDTFHIARNGKKHFRNKKKKINI